MMKKRTFAAVLVFCLLATAFPASIRAANETSVWDGTIAEDFKKGKGTSERPYLIQTASELAFLAKSVNEGTSYYGEYISLESDLDLSGIPWTPIGNNNHVFEGDFQGNAHTISHMSINAPSSDYQGLFGYAEYSSLIHNLRVADATVKGNENVGILGGYLKNVTDCNVSGSVTGMSYVGGIAGRGLNISNCINNANVMAEKSYAGGISAGDDGTYWSAYDTCVNNGRVDSNGECVGGIAAQCEHLNIFNCLNAGMIGGNATDKVGGLVGVASLTNYYYIANCGNLGNVLSGGSAGGLIGNFNWSPMTGEGGKPIQNCFNAGNVSSTGKRADVGSLFGVGPTWIQTCYALKGTSDELWGNYANRATAPSEDAAIFVDAIDTSAFLSLLNRETSPTTRVSFEKWIQDFEVYNGSPYFEPRTVKTIWIGKQPQKTSYIEGEAFDSSGLEVMAFCTDGSNYKLSSSAYTITPAKGTTLKQSNTTVKAFFNTASGNLTAEIPITVEKAGAKVPSAWAADTVKSAIADNLVPQNLQSNYTTPTTRAEFCALATALYESVMGPIVERQSFSDTSDTNVEKMAALGVVNGVGEGRFSPDSKLTREQAATMLARLAAAMGKPLPGQNLTFSDGSSVSAWASDAVGQMQVSGIMGGVGNNTFAPKGDYTREQSIVTMTRLQGVVSQNE